MGLIERNRGSGTTISKDIWGITRKRILAGIAILRLGPFTEPSCYAKIRKEAIEHKLINLATGNYQRIFSKSALREITATRSFIGSLGYDHPLGSEILRTTLTRHIKTAEELRQSLPPY